MKTIWTLAVLLLCGSAAVAGDWPQWLGPNRDASTAEKVAPWKEPLKVLWNKPVGEGHSSPVVAKGQVFLHTQVKGKDEEQVTAYDARSGELVWQSVPTARGKFADPFKFGTGPRATPAVVDGKIYTFGITGNLTCIEADSGKLAWEVDTLKQYKAANLFFGTSCSPLVVGELVLVNVGGKGASIVAFDRKTGAEKWNALDDRPSYSSPIVLGKGQDQQAVFLTAKRLLGLSPLDGRVFWEYPLVDKLQESSTTPAVAGDILFGSSVTFGGAALKLGMGNDGPTAKQLWVNPAYNCYFATPVAVGKSLYLVTGSLLAKKATLRCIDIESGKELWKRDNVGRYHASLLRTGDDKLLLLEEDGDLVLLQPDGAKYQELARSKLCGETWAHAAIADGRLYVRDKSDLICVDLPR
jgi:outer membrane protein assembly factor BamB